MSASIWCLLVAIIGLILTPACASKVFYNHPALTTGGTPAAELTVIRKRAFGGGLVPQTVSLDGEKLVRLWTGSYAVIWVAPNTYSLAVEDTSIEATTEVELRAGERTYILLEPKMGLAASGGISVSNTGTTTSSSALPIAVPVLHPIPEEEARELMGKYDLVGDDPKAVELRKEISVPPFPYQKISDTQGGFKGGVKNRRTFTLALASLGDFDADGVVDLLAHSGVPHDRFGDVFPKDFGKAGVWILLLNPDGRVKAHRKLRYREGGHVSVGPTIAGLGDLDGDGVGDFAEGKNQDDDARGSVSIVFLNRNATAKSLQRIGSAEGGFTGVLRDGDEFGIEVASLGDFDGDQIADLAVGARSDGDGGTRRGAVWILFLNADGTVKSHQKISDTMGRFSGELHDSDRFGESVTSVGDLDGDGIGDLAVSAPWDDDGGRDRGAVWILFLEANGTVRSHQKISQTEGGFKGSLSEGDYFGSSLTSLGDFDGDSVVDLAVGAPSDDDGGTDRGAVWIFLLNVDGTVKGHCKISSTQGGFGGRLQNGDRFGTSVASLGDLRDDGGEALAVNAWGDDDGGPGHGAVWILFLKRGFCGTEVLDD